MKKSILCLVIAVMTVLPLLSCGGDMIHQSNGVAVDIKCPHPYTEEVPARTPTCEHGGHSAFIRCRSCQAALTPIEEIPPTEHAFEKGICTVCGYEELTDNWYDPPIPDPDVLPTLQLFCTQVELYVGEDVWEFNCNAFVANHEVLLFASADESVATVDENGVVIPVSAGETVITFTAQNGEQQVSRELMVVVKEPYAPVTKEDVEVFNVMRDKSITKFESFSMFCVDVTVSVGGKYNEDGLTKVTAGPAEIWNNKLQILFILQNDEVDVKSGVGQEGYDVFFDIYYKPYDALTEKDGGYSKSTVQPWSCVDVSNFSTVYRCGIKDTALMDWEEGTYNVKMVVRRGDLVLGWFDLTHFEWTDSCVAFVNYAKNHSDIIS